MNRRHILLLAGLVAVTVACSTSSSLDTDVTSPADVADVAADLGNDALDDEASPPDVDQETAGDLLGEDLGGDAVGPLVCKVKEHGAKGDGKTLDTAAIQAAIDACGDKGGMVVLEAGTYLSGTLFLKGNMTLHLDQDAMLLGSQNVEDYPKKHLLYGKDLENLVIEGPGSIHGNGPYWWMARLLAGFRPHPMVRLVTVKNLEIRDIFITQSPGWHVHIIDSEDVYIHHVKIRSDVGDNFDSPNTDGLDIDACRHVKIHDCDIEAGDDAIVLKSDGDGEVEIGPMYDVEVYDCVLASWANALKIGTRPLAEVRDVVFRDCLIQASVDDEPGTRAMGGVTLIADAGADVHNILAENLHMTAVQAPFFLRVQQRQLDDGITLPGRLYDITLRNITVDDCDTPALIMGIPEYKVENVTLEDIHIVSSEGGSLADAAIEPPERNLEYPDAWLFGKFPAYGLFMRHVSGPVVFTKNISFGTTAAVEERPAVIHNDVDTVDFTGLAEGTTVVDTTPKRD